MSLTDLEMDLLLAQAEVATLKREAKGNMFTVPDDFVKVVRCKDCKYYSNCTCWIMRGKMKPDDFCSYGKLKDGDNHG